MYSSGFLGTTLASIGVFTQSNNLVNKKRKEAAWHNSGKKNSSSLLNFLLELYPLSRA